MSIHNEGVTGTLFWNVFPWPVEALFTAREKFVHPGHIGGMAMSSQKHDGSKFDFFIAGELMSWQLFIQRGKQMKMLGRQIQTVWRKVQLFPTGMLHKYQVCPTMCSRTLSSSRTTPSLKSLGQCQCQMTVNTRALYRWQQQNLKCCRTSHHE
jgi:hypothetical protein